MIAPKSFQPSAYSGSDLGADLNRRKVHAQTIFGSWRQGASYGAVDPATITALVEAGGAVISAGVNTFGGKVDLRTKRQKERDAKAARQAQKAKELEAQTLMAQSAMVQQQESGKTTRILVMSGVGVLVLGSALYLVSRRR